MEFSQFWQEYKELVIIIVTAVTTLTATLLGQKILPGIWKALIKLLGKIITGLVKHLSAEKFEQRYLKWLCEEYRFLQVRGIRTRSPVAVELEKVYVSLKLNRPSRGRLGAKEEDASPLEKELTKNTQLRIEVLSGIRTEERERLAVSEVLQHCPERLIILGGPGTGKTTLLSYLALKFARGQAKEILNLDEKRLPILIHLRELPRTGLSLTVENIPALCTTPGLTKECPEDFFKKRLEGGSCIMLLDGMDEITDEIERRQLAEQIEDFVTTYRDNRYIVTSRPAGYGKAALTGFTQLDVCDLKDEDVEAFARYWCLTVELAVRGVEREFSEAVARRRAEREANELVAAIRASDRVRNLTVNPLLLTIVAMVHRYRATLPNRRVELYDECTEVLLGYWDEAKGIAGQLDWKRKRRILEPLAHWMHHHGLRETDYTQAEKIISQALPSVGEKETKASEFLRDVRERSGLLMERGLGIYGFSHLTLQEYLTAAFLIDQGEKGREELLKLLDDSWWREVILLYVGMQDATPLIQAILTRRDDFFKNNLFLAARCLVDVVNIEPHVQDSVLSRVMEEFITGEFDGLCNRAYSTLIELGNSPSAPKVVDYLVDLLSHEEAKVRERAANALGRLGMAEPSVEGGLVGLIGDDEAKVRSSAVNALGRLGKAEPNVVERLVDLMGDEKESVQWSAAKSLILLSKTEPSVVEILVGLMGDTDENVRFHAAYSLGELGKTEPSVVERLVGLMGDEEANVRWSATYALGELGELGKIESSVVKGLVVLMGDEEANIRSNAAYALGELGEIEPGVVEGLVGLMGDEEAVVRGSAALALGALGEIKPGVVEGLVGLMRDEDADVRSDAADAMGELGKTDPSVVLRLVGLMGDEESNVRSSAAFALGALGEIKPGVVEGLVGLMGDEESNVRSSAADALGKLGEIKPGVVEGLVGLMGDEESNVRSSAADALGKLGEIKPGVVEGLVGLMGDEEANVRWSAAFALGELGEIKPGVVEGLVGLMRDKDENVRVNVSFALVKLGKDESVVVEKLVGLLGHADENVRNSAALALSTVMWPREYGIHQIPPNVIPILINFLGDGREVKVPDSERRYKVKDVAWQLLQHYSEKTGEHIYRDYKEE